MSANVSWPVVAGSYELGDPQGPVAVCALTSEELVAPLAHLPGVAIAGKVYTANLGIERIILNIAANPAIRFLLICGKDSPLFRQGQSLVALAEAGVDADKRIVGAAGYEPVLPTLPTDRVARFRRQVETLDWIGEEDLAALTQGIAGLVARNPGRFPEDGALDTLAAPPEPRFISIRPGGQREPLQYDPSGYFVITLDREAEEIVLRHYLPDHAPAHEMRGRSAGPMLLGLLREQLVSQLSHAGYLGEELAKAQAALRLGLRYDQDRPLRPRDEANTRPSAPSPEGPTPAAVETPPRMPPIAPPLTAAQLQAVALGDEVNVALAVTSIPTPDLLEGVVLDSDEAEPFGAYHRTAHPVRVRWSPATQVVMGGQEDLRVGALLRARGRLGDGATVEAERIAVLTEVARIIGG